MARFGVWLRTGAAGLAGAAMLAAAPGAHAQKYFRGGGALYDVEAISELPVYDLWHSYLSDGLTVAGGLSISYWKYNVDAAPRDYEGRKLVGLAAFGFGRPGEIPVGVRIWARGDADVVFEDVSGARFDRDGAAIRMRLTDYACRGRIVCDRGEIEFRISPDGEVRVDGRSLGRISEPPAPRDSLQGSRD